MAAAVFAAYGPAVSYQLVWDDADFILHDERVHHMGNWTQMFTQGTESLYRPLKTLLYAIGYRLWGEWPGGYHLAAVLFHLGCSLLVFELLGRLSADGRVGLWAGLLFALHPVQVESVAFISAGFDLPGLLLYLLAFWLYVVAGENSGGVSKGSLAGRERRTSVPNIFLVLSWLAFAGAVLGSEMATTLPLTLGAYEVCRRGRLAMGDKRFLLGRWLGYWVILGCYLGVRFGMVRLGLRAQSYPGNGFLATLLTQLVVFGKYLSLLIVPYPLCADYRCFPVEESLFSVRWVLSLSLVVLFVVLVLRLGRKRWQVGFALLWMLLVLLPVSHVVPIDRLLAERYLYLCVMGFVWLAAMLIRSWRRPVGQLTAGAVLGVLLVMLYFLGTTLRRPVWSGPETFWPALVAQTPDNAPAWNNLGLLYVEQGRASQALNALDRAIQLDASVPEYFWNRGKLLRRQGQRSGALADYLHALSLSSTYGEIYNDLGILYEEMGLETAALDAYWKAVRFRPNLYEAQMNLGRLSLQRGNRQTARQAFEYAAGLQPYRAEAYRALGEVLIQAQQPEAAARALQRSLSLDANQPEVWHNLGLTVAQLGRTEEGISCIERALRLRPRYSQALLNLGVILRQSGRPQEAQAAFRKALEIEPDQPLALKNLQLLKEYEEAAIDSASAPAGNVKEIRQ